MLAAMARISCSPSSAARISTSRFLAPLLHVFIRLHLQNGQGALHVRAFGFHFRNFCKDNVFAFFDIEHEVLYLLNCLARNPERIVTPQTPRGHSQRLDTLKAELDELISQLPVDENRTREVLREIAAEMYADIDPREYETQRLRRLFQKEAPRSELDANLIAMSISAVMVDGNGNVKIRLKNDHIVERGEQNG